METNCILLFFSKRLLLNKLNKSFVSRVIRPSIVDTQKQPPRGVPWKSCSENMQQIYTRTPIPKCDFQNTFLKNTSGWMLLNTLPIAICSISCLKRSITPYSMNIFSNFTFHKKTYLLACCLKMKNEIICSSFSQYQRDHYCIYFVYKNVTRHNTYLFCH